MEAIRRKLVPGQQQPRPQGGAAGGAWRLAFARAVQEAMGLELRFDSPRLAELSLAELLETLPERALIAMLEGPKGGLGLIVLGPGLMAGLIEMQTFGRLTATDPLPRRPTRTDAAMVTGVLDTALAGLAAALVTDPDRVWTDGFRITSHIEDPRPLGLLLEDIAYRTLTAEVVLGKAEKSGALILALPAMGCGRQPEIPAGAVVGTGAGAAAQALLFRAALSAQVEEAEVRLTAVIARLHLPLDRVMALRPGDSLPLGSARIDRVDLEGMDGLRIAGGKMGQSRGQRALRLNPDSRPAAREVMDNIARGAGPASLEADMRRLGTGT
ncbi:FliM/FliN family flagellar motor switch protein [Szabonella alba]|uniref:FliM/FliN family flagellar motor switch protein n=1 Tax=Szabonella alba TaxID=2804194 RepID=A0A8K0Y275_9RHOB|nr:FliM/FliN family flagellar motor C-terminal domain-containing protein [Szabonella alba]MBL4918872.1 FliM/FliN family flagellar motor switch protein [Szabonella alba]